MDGGRRWRFSLSGRKKSKFEPRWRFREQHLRYPQIDRWTVAGGVTSVSTMAGVDVGEEDCSLDCSIDRERRRKKKLVLECHKQPIIIFASPTDITTEAASVKFVRIGIADFFLPHQKTGLAFLLRIRISTDVFPFGLATQPHFMIYCNEKSGTPTQEAKLKLQELKSGQM
ncbi:hypothetical protein L2E82_29282 [Cichorium intybus]|uniref:Uncharacterized protein n=1 Tax=Cichorium intybus TaxID=13427 RepID=A0ACB9CXA0_CICIN|nr:hypothetical protein L2E82_29282 [Cichorium intybus]